MRVLVVFDGDADASRRLIALVVGEVEDALGAEEFASAVQLRVLDISREPSRRVHREQSRAAEIIIGIDREHLRRLAVPLLRRQRVFTLEELTLTLEHVARATGAGALVSVWERGYAAFSRSVVAAACTARVLVPTGVHSGRRHRAATTEQYGPRLGRVLSELLIGRAWAA
ncbi:hypothetical protein [Agrococcus sp. Marseille-P2731]|uniref:hypothetical protein n=1 Tax=Agrococcus sp. Marseille-P2731 TaxID=1841862 RepID=UPI00092FE09D|nr:hypothetical protein [Agrococcus sp. Marseille-P2731]